MPRGAILMTAETPNTAVRNERSAAPRRTQAQLLIALVDEASTDLFQDRTGGLYATVPVRNHLETWCLRSRDFKAWMRRRFYEQHEKPPAADAVTQALGVLEARAQFDGQSHPVFVRVGERGGNLHLDLGRPDWEGVEISASGWQTVSQPPVKFRRGRGTAALPLPIQGAA